MKRLLPVLALSALTSAACAATPAPLSYSRIGLEVSESHDTASGSTITAASVNTLSLSMLLGKTDFLATVSDDQYYTIFGLGYVFRNVGFSTDVVLSVSSGAHFGVTRATLYGIQLRRALPEIHEALEASVSYSVSNAPSGGSAENTFRGEIAYNLDANYQFAVGLVNTDVYVSGGQSYLTLTARYNF